MRHFEAQSMVHLWPVKMFQIATVKNRLPGGATVPIKLILAPAQTNMQHFVLHHQRTTEDGQQNILIGLASQKGRYVQLSIFYGYTLVPTINGATSLSHDLLLADKCGFLVIHDVSFQITGRDIAYLAP